MPETDYARRRTLLLEQLREARLDAMLVTSLANVRYLSGFSGSNAMLLVGSDAATLLTDPRYTLQAGEEADCAVEIVHGPLLTEALQQIAGAKVKRLAFERTQVSYETWRLLSDGLPSRTRLIGAQELIETLRMVKSAGEIELIRQSMNTASAAYEAVLKTLEPGQTELDVAAEIDYKMRRLGAEQVAFETIVAAGPRSAMPHARPTANRLAGDQLLLIDMGALRAGYTSDMTRVAHFGKPPRKTLSLYKAVLEAQLAALDAVRAGITAGHIDRKARQALAKHGLEKAFVHSTGHGLGLEIHERPRVGRGEKTRLVEGMVITIEPGAYIPGYCGVRIEDTVVVGKRGAEKLTSTPKELAIL